jgi:hypothetical protein
VIVVAAPRELDRLVFFVPPRSRLDPERPVEPDRDVAIRGLQVVVPAQRVQRIAQLAGVREPLVGFARQRAQHDRIELGRAALVERRRRHRVAALDLHQRLVLVLGREQRARGQQLVRDHADREQIAARIEVFAGERLGRHVRELALDPAGLRAQLRRLRLGDPEVDDLDLPGAGHQHVRRRHVAVDQPHRVAVVVDLGVRVVERIAELEQQPDGDVDRRRTRHLARLAQDAANIAAVDVLHRDEVLRTDATELEDPDDVDVVEQRGELGLAHE